MEGGGKDREMKLQYVLALFLRPVSQDASFFFRIHDFLYRLWQHL